MHTKGNCTNQGTGYAESVYSVLAKFVLALIMYKAALVLFRKKTQGGLIVDRVNICCYILGSNKIYPNLSHQKSK